MGLDSPNTVSLLHTIGENNSTSFVDESGKIWTARGGAKISTAQAKFGLSSGLLNGSTDWIDTPSHPDFELENNKFTIDWWEFRLSVTGGQSTISRDATTTYTPYLLGYSNGSNALLAYMSSTGSSWDIASGKNLGSLTLNVWSHRAAVRADGNTFFLFKDGNITDTWTLGSSLSFAANSNPFSVGKSQGGAYFPGYFTEIHIMNGEALYTSPFTPPPAPYGPSFVPRIICF